MPKHLPFLPVTIAIIAGWTEYAWSNPVSDELIEQALTLREQGDDSGALPLLEQAYDIAPSPRGAAQLALVHQALGNWVSAERYVHEALAAAGDPWVARTRATLMTALETIEGRLGSLQVVGNPVGAEIRFGGEVIGLLPMDRPMRVVAQRGVLTVSAAGFHPVQIEITVGPRSKWQERISLEPLLVAQDRSHISLPEPRNTRIALGVAFGAVNALPYHYTLPETPGDFGNRYDAFASLFRIDLELAIPLGSSWDLVTQLRLGIITFENGVVVPEFALGARARPVPRLSSWYTSIGALVGAYIPIGVFKLRTDGE